MVSVVPGTLVPVSGGEMVVESPVRFRVSIKKDFVDVFSPSTTVILYSKGSEESTWNQIMTYTCSKCMASNPYDITFDAITVFDAGDVDFAAVDSSDMNEINVPSSDKVAFLRNIKFSAPPVIPGNGNGTPLPTPGGININEIISKYGLYIAIGGAAIIGAVILFNRRGSSGPNMASAMRSTRAKREHDYELRMKKLEEDLKKSREEDEARKREEVERRRDERLEEQLRRIEERASKTAQSTSQATSPQMMGAPFVAYPPMYNGNRPPIRELREFRDLSEE